MPREALLVRTLVELAEGLTSDIDVVDFLTVLSERSVELLAVDEAGVLLADAGGRLRVVAASNEIMDLLELFEVQNAEGPGLDCYRTGRPVTGQDLRSRAASDRWPGFAHRARSLGFSVVHALPLRLRGELLGSIGFFAAAAEPLTADDLLVGQALADVASVSIVHARALREAETLADHLELAVRSRVVIEQAKGVVAERAGLSVAEAFTVLRRHARLHDRRLSWVAGEVVAGRLSVDALMSEPSLDDQPGRA